MAWFRKTIVSLLTLLLFVSLVGGALATSAKLNLSQPAKIESWLNQSNLYSGVVGSALDQAQETADSNGSLTISFHDTAVQQAAYAALSPQLVQQSINTFLAGNYNWLEGKASTPVFSINLTAAKRSFAAQVGQAADKRLSSLPVCSTVQLSQIGDVGSINPFTVGCRPSFIDPQSEAASLKAAILNDSGFLNNPVLTANQPNPNETTQNKPYYQRHSQLPTAYQTVMKLPWFCAVAAILCVIGIVFLAVRRRKGLRLVGLVLVLSGVILIATNFFFDGVLHLLENHVFNGTSIGQLQRALTNFLNTAERHLVRVNLWIGIAYLILAALIFAGLLATGTRKPRSPESKPRPPSQQPPAPPATPIPQLKPRQPSPPKRPRLIQ